MESSIDWRFIAFCFSVFQFVLTAGIFAIIKFNDLAHVEQDLKKIESKVDALSFKVDARYVEMLKCMNEVNIKLAKIDL